MPLSPKVTKELDYEDPGNIAVGNTHEMTVAVYDDTNPSHTGKFLMHIDLWILHLPSTHCPITRNIPSG